ncbi:MAG: TlpA family protein disulfide reductase [Geopsychrobacter sp.]|nr:TlpA family protein disulfide reductase [Geopsychrobacter sp.]
MKKLLLLLFLCFPLPALAGSDRPQVTPQLVTAGRMAPDFTLENMQGENVTLSQFRGKVVIVNFWATWCPPCRREMPSMEVLHQTFKDDDLVLLAINVENGGRGVVSGFLKESPYSFPILLDSQAEVQKLYGVFQFPESFIVDRNGLVVKKVIGAVPWMGGDIYNLLHFMLKG